MKLRRPCRSFLVQWRRRRRCTNSRWAGRRRSWLADEGPCRRSACAIRSRAWLDGGVDAGDLLAASASSSRRRSACRCSAARSSAICARHDLVLVVARDVVCGAPGTVGFAHFRACVDGRLCRAVHGLHRPLRTGHAGTPQSNSGSSTPISSRAVSEPRWNCCAAPSSRHVDEARGLRQAEVARGLLGGGRRPASSRCASATRSMSGRSTRILRQVGKSIREQNWICAPHGPSSRVGRSRVARWACSAEARFRRRRREALFTGSLQLVEVADLFHATRKVRRSPPRPASPDACSALSLPRPAR